MKTCIKCGDTKEPTEFSKHTGNRDGLQCWCRKCLYAQVNNRNKERKADDPEYRKKTNAQSVERNKMRYANDPAFKSKVDHHSMLRERKLVAQFNSLSFEEQEAIIEFYSNRPKGYHVDHIYPVVHGGLHCLSNLQYLLARDNHTKHDKIPANIDIDGTLILWS